MGIYAELSLILGIVLAISALMRVLKQPLIIGYILAGIAVGPTFLNILKSTETIGLFSDLGITALLFVIGLGLNPKVIKELGFVSFVTGFGQVTFTSLIGYFIAGLLGFGFIESLYIGIALAFSSTIIILKLLSDKGDVHKLYGRVSIGFLLVQDLIATIILVALASLSNSASSDTVVLSVFLLLVKGFLVLVGLFTVSHFLLPKLGKFVASSQEFLFIFSLAWGFGIATMYERLGLTVEIGALVAGITLSMTPYAHEIASKFKPLRDFFIILFFVLLGFHMEFSSWQTILLPVAIFSAFIFIGNPLIVFVLMNLLGFNKRTGFLAGLTVAQISEFSLILVALGFSLGHISKDTLSMITLIGVFTIAGSTYLILYAEEIYKKISRVLGKLEIRKIAIANDGDMDSFDAILFGYQRVGAEFVEAFRKSGNSFLVVDFNPYTIQALEEKGIECEYGDAEDIEFLQELSLSEVKIVVSTMPDFEANILVTQMVREVNKTAVVIIIADTLDKAKELYETGATHVILPHYLGAHFAATMIVQNSQNPEKYDLIREEQMKYIERLKKNTLEGISSL